MSDRLSLEEQKRLVREILNVEVPPLPSPHDRVIAFRKWRLRKQMALLRQWEKEHRFDA